MKSQLLVIGVPLVSLACRGPAERALAAVPPPVTIAEAYLTRPDTTADIDSPAVWHGPAGQHWILVTAKATDVIRVVDASTGALVRDVGGEGKEPGRFDRPNGIAVADDFVFVVERDNRRVQVLTLPEFRPIGSYGGRELIKPYGITVRRHGPGDYDTWITDNYELSEGQIPPDSALGRRVKQFRVTVDSTVREAELVRSFGATSGPGVLRVVESLQADPPNGRLLIAEELEGRSQIKVYDLDGRFAGDTIPSRFFPHQAEGIALYWCGERDGYWIATDQGYDANTFHLFDRQSLAHRGSFRGPATLNTDGIALTQVAVPGFPAGFLVAVHDDANLSVFDWTAIGRALGLRTDCAVGAVSAP
jgi:3-phytase